MKMMKSAFFGIRICVSMPENALKQTARYLTCQEGRGLMFHKLLEMKLHPSLTDALPKHSDMN